MIIIVMVENCSFLKYNCDLCFYQTNKKFNLKRHHNNKHCNIKLDKNIDSKICENVIPVGENVIPNGENVIPKFICKKCNKIYNSNRYLLKHEKNCNGLDDLTCPKCMISFTNRHNKSRHIKRNTCSPKSIIHARQPNPQNVNIVTNNIENQTNIVNNITNNYTINNYGNERLDYLSYEKLIAILKTGYDVPRLLTKEIHFNKEFPENNNIQYKNDTCALIKTDDDFILKDLNILAEELVNEKTLQMQKFAKENKEDICLKIENQKYQEIVELLLQFILLKEPQEHYKKQITKIKDMIKNKT